LAVFEQAVQVDPNYVYAWKGIVEVLRQLRRYEEAEEAEEKVAQLVEEGYGDDEDEFPDLILIFPELPGS